MIYRSTVKPSKKHTNALIDETSPYLLQHAHNPVDWHAWKPEVLEMARKENKPLLISIGYAACHWCHVMEHECFEDEAVAEVMNRHFINIKIDREERPDIDHIYMDALQMMTGSGGWPLNVVALPDGRPFWGATYVRKPDWIKVLNQLASLFSNDREKVLDYASQLAEGLRSINLIPKPEKEEGISRGELRSAVKGWSQYFDTFLGGYKRAPKFMMPVNLDFLIHYSTLYNDGVTEDYVHTTLRRMAYGGIYDHLGGGFSRYAVDVKWHVPHFEKMLYDNAQLISLYAKAYASAGELLYRKVVVESVSFVTRELMSPDGGFYSSLDADSLDQAGNLKEGAYYAWTEEELRSALKGDWPVFADYYNINEYGHWEDDFYVLIRDASDTEIARKHDIKVEDLNRTIEGCKMILLKKRETRPRPRLDDKILTSWNALMIKALAEAYRYLGKEDYLKLARDTATFLEAAVVKEDGSLYHNHKAGKSSIEGFLEDYANLIDAYISLYEVSFDEIWVKRAKELTDHCLEHFLDRSSGLFYFTSDVEAVTVRRSFETADNVTPASNSVMVNNLFKLSLIYPGENYSEIANTALLKMRDNILENPNSHAHWLHLPLYFNFPFREVVITGASAEHYAASLRAEYLPNCLLAGAVDKGSLSLIRDRIDPLRTLVYICENGACKLPVSSPDEALKHLRTES
jgi:uncharacterized protein YyaL (SSP411 family)